MLPLSGRSLEAAPFGLGFASALLLAPFLANVARRWDLVSYPRPERWSHAATPLLGGLAILAGTTTAALLPQNRAPRVPMLCGAWCCWALGVLDDVRALGPSEKLTGVAGAHLVEQIAGAILTRSRPAACQSLVTTSIGLISCLCGATAVNMADNMDSLAGGCGALAAAAAAQIRAIAAAGDPSPAVPTAAALSGACLGFLAWNAHPAHLFMGDSGSLPLGYLLSRLALSPDPADRGRGGSEIPVAMLLFTVPLLECVVPVIRRRLGGRSLLRGGTDHLSHALAGTGLPEPLPAFILLAVQCAACSAAVTVAMRQSTAAPRQRNLAGRRVRWLALASSCTAGIILARAHAGRVCRNTP